MKHTEHKCKICGKEFKISLELLSYMAQEHYKKKKVWTPASSLVSPYYMSFFLIQFQGCDKDKKVYSNWKNKIYWRGIPLMLR